jgi:L-alanine-DL-glutamate epimerase-like enolase superfamily enzyme
LTSGTTIVAVDTFAVDVPLREPFAIATGAQLVADVALVEVTLASGAVGLGEAAPFAAVSGETRAGALTAIDELRGDLLGSDAREHRALADRMRERAAGRPAARAALEMGILDALARHWGAPLWALFGGAGPRRLTTDLTITAGDGPHAQCAARDAMARGFDTLKVKVAAGEVAADLERLLGIREAAPAAHLILDANGGWGADDAIALLDQLRQRGIPVAAFEQPVATGDLEGLAAVTRASGPTRVLADESARSAADVVELVRRRAVHGVNLKITKTGVAEAIAMATVARSAGLDLMVGGMVETEIAMGFSAHLVRGLGGVAFIDLDTPFFLARRVSEGGVAFEGPVLEVGDAPGLAARRLPSDHGDR